MGGTVEGGFVRVLHIDVQISSRGKWIESKCAIVKNESCDMCADYSSIMRRMCFHQFSLSFHFK